MSFLNKNDSVARVKLLALHGSGSNRDVTGIQLKNLGLDESDYEIIYADGPLLVEQPGFGIAELDGLVSGPWYSWLPSGDQYNTLSTEQKLDAICNAIEHVMEIVDSQGPFDGVFGFSQGAVIAALINSLPNEPVLQSALEARLGSPLKEDFLSTPSFPAAVFACAAAPCSLPELRMSIGLDAVPALVPEIRSLHLIGLEDKFKAWSESLAMHMNGTDANTHYLAGGHEISRIYRNDPEIEHLLQACFDTDEAKAQSRLDWQNSSLRSARAIHTEHQVVTVSSDMTELAETIIDMFARRPQEAPLFRNAREKDADIYTSYGQMLDFCLPGGAGDLRRLGVKPGEVVAYLAPAGGSAVAACAFLSISAQTCAAPFSHSMSEADATMALEQYGVKHMILFGTNSARGVKAAFQAYAESGKARLHYATDGASSTPGLFEYLHSEAGFEAATTLYNPASANALLLRTSGTTSTPKIVPLKQRDLALNAAILADGIGIDASDVTYSVMPLDHIGGISASILCSVAVGAAITCDGIYNPQSSVEALSESNPKPTWYSAVPTIHNATAKFLQDNAATYLDEAGKWQGHGLRMIRSGAAALKEADKEILELVFDRSVIPTYSMSEMMPICQPPIINKGWYQLPNSVGVPVASSLAIVDPVTLQPMPFGEQGEIAISGETVFSGYMDNQEANSKSRFLMKSPADNLLHEWFLTGDLGEVDNQGSLVIRGRIKELIKRGGEQVSPAEVEAVLSQHSAINTAVCFSVPSEVYGEEVGCAIVLESSVSDAFTAKEIERDMRKLLRDNGLASYKIPSHWRLVEKEQLPMTASKKYIRNGLAQVLGVSAEQNNVVPIAPPPVREPERQPAPAANDQFAAVAGASALDDKPKVDWATLAGLRFVLACYVMFMHIGSNESWDAFSNLRQFPWHVHAFFAVAGFSLAIIMPSFINRKMSFVSARITGMYPLYGLAILFAMGNLLVSCQPSTFSAVFNWSPLLSSTDQMFCQGTPLVQDSWLANVLLTLGIHLTGLQATPAWGASWFLGFYLWFISMYFQCLIVFPFVYNALYKNRGNTKRLLLVTAGALAANALIILGFWYGYALEATGYGLFDPLTGMRLTPNAEQVAEAGKDNAIILGFYLFAPFWMIYFVAGMCAAFLFDAIRPAEGSKAKLWGYVADAITVFIIIVSVGHVAQGYFHYGPNVTQVALDPFFMRPEAANSFADPSTVNRIWDNIYARLFAPITLLWIFALSTGQGMTARVLKFSPLSQTLAPTAYACFLFHQMVGQWYYAATRNGEWWNWWTHQKTFYWFSPQPVPVEWYEYFYVVGLVVIFAKAVQPLDPLMRRGWNRCVALLQSIKRDANEVAETKDTTTRILEIVQRTTGMEVNPDWSLEDCGLASLGVVQFANTLELEFSQSDNKIRLSVPDIMEAQTIREIASIVDAAIDNVQNKPPTPQVGSPQLA